MVLQHGYFSISVRMVHWVWFSKRNTLIYNDIKNELSNRLFCVEKQPVLGGKTACLAI